MGFLVRLLTSLPLLIISPLLMVVSACALLMADLLWRLYQAFTGRTAQSPESPQPRSVPTAATVVIPNWNGRDLLERYLPALQAAMVGNPSNEILVVDNGSSDGSVEFLRERFPRVNVLPLPANLGFGGGSNAGFLAASNDIVVLLNSDMRVDKDFLAPLL